MSELFDKQVNAQKEINFQGSPKLPQAREKVCDENETNKQRRRRNKQARKMLLMEGGRL